ncbi:MAG: family 78 glycoside hydrolase catalytic domain [Clostridia bacterium]|nr:family 78 glycoside hydrolase catalytic domain [Clostridia bacterium]
MNIPMNFICKGHEFNTPEKYVPQPYFRRKFEVKKDLESAILLIGSLGFYEVHINTKNITKGIIAPYRANPDHYIYFDRYDITNELGEGENILASILGNGTQNTVIRIWGGLRFPWRSAPALSFEITLKYKDGTEETVISDENTLCCDSPIIFNDFHFGEYYDARLECKGWDSVDFDDSKWTPAIPRLATRGEARICEAEPVTIQQEIAPVSVTEYEGGYIYDFGVNEAGLCRLHINGTEGQKIVMKHFEIMVDGKPYYKNIRYNGCERAQDDEYICSGGEVTHLPRFTYHGFRYVYVEGITKEQATPDLLTYLTVHSNIKMRGSFECDNEIINKIQEACVRSSLCNLQYVITDSPHREKNGWTADAALSAEQMLYNMEPETTWREWLRNVYKSMKDDGMIPGIIPTADWGYEDFNGPCWDCVLVYLPYWGYQYRKDIKTLKECAIPVFRYINYLYTLIDKNNLIEAPGGLGDWAQVGRSSGRAFKTPCIFTDSVISMDIARKAAFIFEVLGMKENAEYAKKLENRLYEGIRANLIDFNTGIVCGNTQTSQAMTIFYGLVHGEEKRKVYDHLLSLIEKDKEHMNVGVLGGKVLFRVLCENSHHELAYRMIVRTDFPAYGNLIARGATTLWEFFDAEGAKIDSLNHHFWSDISAFFYRYLAGININPTAKDVDNVNIEPVFIDDLKHIKAEHIHPAGKISVELVREQYQVHMTVECPDAIHGEVKIPYGWRFKDNTRKADLHSGKYIIYMV